MAPAPHRRRRRAAWTLALVGHAVLVGLGALAVQGRPHPATAFLVGAGLAAAAPLGLLATGRRIRSVRWLLVLAGLPGATLLQAGTGGVSSPVAVLLVVALVWVALLGTPTELALGLLVTLVCCLVPMYVVGAPTYPVLVPQATLLALVALTVALTLSVLARQTRRLGDRVRRETHIDGLTGLANRRGFDEQAERLLAGGSPVCVAVLDLDGLGQVNRALGHDEGDRVLRATGQRLTMAFPVHAVVARLGGGEFAVLTADADPGEVVRVLDRVRICTPSDAQFSAGVAESSGPGESGGDLLRLAGVALHRAKVTGRGLSCVADAPGPAHEATGERQPDLVPAPARSA